MLTSNLLPLKDMAKLLLAGISPEEVARMHHIDINKLAELLGEGQRLRELVEEGQKRMAGESSFDFDGQWKEVQGIQRELSYQELEVETLKRAVKEMKNLGNKVSMGDLMKVLTVCNMRRKAEGSLVEINIGNVGNIGSLDGMPEYLRSPEKPMITVNEQGQVLKAGGRELAAMPSLRLTEVLKQALPSQKADQ